MKLQSSDKPLSKRSGASITARAGCSASASRIFSTTKGWVILAALGIVVSARKKKEAERIKKTNQFYGYNQDYDNIDYFSNDYEPFKWGK